MRQGLDGYVSIGGWGTDHNDQNIVAGNFIGTDAAGTAKLGNGTDGVTVGWGTGYNRIGTNGDGVADEAERNVISANANNGVCIVGAGSDNNVVAGNYIGTDVFGIEALGNLIQGVCVLLGACHNRIGTDGNGRSDSAERNVISGNGRDGVIFWSAGADENVVAGNYIGTDVSGKLVLGNGWNGVEISAGPKSNIIGTNGDGFGDEAERNVISGNAGNGVLIWNAGSNSNVVAGNFIGTDLTGSRALGNGRYGVAIEWGALHNLIGTDADGVADDAERNVISGNACDGVLISGSGSDHNVVAGNFIGTDLSGTRALGNANCGVLISGGAQANQIGGAPALANRIAFNGAAGVVVRQPTWVISGAPITGPEGAGTALRFDGEGDFVEIPNSPTLHSDRQLTVSGWFMVDDLSNRWQAIFAKMNLPETATGDNYEVWVGVNSADSLHLVSTPASRVGVGNLALETNPFVQVGRWYHFAVVINADSNLMQIYVDGQLAATSSYDPSGIRATTGPLTFGAVPGAGYALSASLDEISIWNVARTQAEIQSDMYRKLNDDEPGLVAYWDFDEGAGDTVYDQTPNGNNGTLRGGTATRNRIQANAIFSNGGLGIDLGNDGLTPNDPDDTDTGPNNLQNFPVIAIAEPGATTHLVGTLNSTPNTAFTVDFYDNTSPNAAGFVEGERYLGSTVVTTDADGNATFDVTLPVATTLGEMITATATDPNGNTSEFSRRTILTNPPVADAGGPYSIDEGEAAVLNASASWDPDGDPLTIAWDLDGDGEFDDAAGATPTVLWSELLACGIGDDGTYTVSVRVMDDKEGVAEASAELTVQNVSPTAADQLAATDEDHLATLNVLEGLFDPGTWDTHEAVPVSFTTVKGGLVVILSDGQATYDPNGQFESLGDGESDTDTFSYVVRDDDGGEGIATVTVEISGVNDAPVAEDQTVTVAEDGSVTITLHGSDVETAEGDLTFTITSLPARGAFRDAAGNEVTAGQQFTGAPTLSFEPGASCDMLGTFPLEFTVTDRGDPDVPGTVGLTSDPAAVAINVVVTVGEGTATLDGGILRIGGTSGDDSIVVARRCGGGNLTVLLNDQVVCDIPAAQVSEVRIWGRAGNDAISLVDLALLSMIHGGDGNDVLTGGAGNDLIFGGRGDDTIVGAARDDFLVGGFGADRIVGSAGNDVLVAGQITCGYTRNDLREIGRAWANCQAVDAALEDDVLDEPLAAHGFDMLTGSAGADWFIIGEGDIITDLRGSRKGGDLATIA